VAQASGRRELPTAALQPRAQQLPFAPRMVPIGPRPSTLEFARVRCVGIPTPSTFPPLLADPLGAPQQAVALDQQMRISCI
jgi:hypothetical protein